MGKVRTVIHCNPGLKHQRQHAEALRDGFARHDIEAEISFTPDTPADIHVISGPWFALRQWRYCNTLMIDRAYWGDPDCVSIHWLRGGEKVRLRHMPYRDHPELQPMKRGSRRIYLCDYGEKPSGEYDEVRFHPSDVPSIEPLEKALERHDIAAGRKTTALVDAAIAGLTVETTDPYSPVFGIVDREQWITDLAWHNWSLDEIESGAFLDALGYYS